MLFDKLVDLHPHPFQFFKVHSDIVTEIFGDRPALVQIMSDLVHIAADDTKIKHASMSCF